MCPIRSRHRRSSKPAEDHTTSSAAPPQAKQLPHAQRQHHPAIRRTVSATKPRHSVASKHLPRQDTVPEHLGTHTMPRAEKIKEVAPTFPHKERKGSGEQRVAAISLSIAAFPPSELFGRPFIDGLQVVLRGPSEWSVGERELFASFV
jgi:hypothetical protein